jgi:hypothetical protein
MAVVEIARIQVRRGQENQTGVPQLAGGEFAWAADTEKLYIGLKREDGGARDANVEILTENSLRTYFSTFSALATTATYIYRVGTLITAENGMDEFERTVQDKLDDLDVSIENFGEVGVGGDDHSIFQYALDNLFLNSLSLPGNPARVLRLPAGTFRTSETMFIPKNTTIIGEGSGKTKIILTSTGTHVFQTVDAGSSGGLAGYINFDNTSSITSAMQPSNIRIEGLSLEYDTSVNITQAKSLISLDCADNAIIRDVKFKGKYDPIISATTSPNYAGIDIRGFYAVTSENVTIENCEFNGISYGIKSNYDILSPYVNNCRFYYVDRGVVFNETVDPAALIGPRFSRILNSRFKDVARQAIFVGTNTSVTSTNHISMNNEFINVGNNIVGTELSVSGTPVITFSDQENQSINDFFNRFETQMNNAGSSLTFNPLISGKASINLVTGRSITLNAGATGCLVRIPITGEKQLLTVDYNAENTTLARSGKLDINVGGTANPTISITDNFNVVTGGDSSVNWTSTKNTGSKWIEIRATNDEAAAITIKFKANLIV